MNINVDLIPVNNFDGRIPDKMLFWCELLPAKVKIRSYTCKSSIGKLFCRETKLGVKFDLFGMIYLSSQVSKVTM